MSGVFVSHASADKALVDEFVDCIVRLGSGLGPNEIFYSSGEDTGVPSGTDLLHHVRTRVGEAQLVVAVVSPTFQTRPVCIAELGAAWSRVDNLFPLAVPGMKRTDLEGVLEGMTVRFLDDSAALDELHDRIGAVVERTATAATWSKYKAKWLSNVGRLVKSLPTVRAVSLADVERLEADLEGARDALTDSERERAELLDQIDELSKTRPVDAVKRIRLPKNDLAKFETLRDDAAKALGQLPRVVRDAVWFDLVQGEMPWPDGYEDRAMADAAQDAVDDGYLVENGNEMLEPNNDFDSVGDAIGSVDLLQRFLAEPSEAFEEWFRAEFKMPPDLRKKAVWTELLT